MAAYYNEFNPFVAQWLRNLIGAGLIAPGDVDERSICDVSEDDLRGYTQCHLFAGLGGWSLAFRLAGWEDDRPAWSASAPCQPFSADGLQVGFDDDRDLWPHVARLVEKRRPTVLFGEQVTSAPWLSRTRRDMEEMGYAVGAMPIKARTVGARHGRPRYWFVADAQWDEQPREEPCSREAGRVGRVIEPFPWHEPWEGALSRFRIVGDGLPRSVGATDAARNAIVPQVAAEFIAAYMEAA